MKATIDPKKIGRVAGHSVVPYCIIKRLAAEPFAVEPVKSGRFRVLDTDKTLHGWYLYASDIKIFDHPT